MDRKIALPVGFAVVVLLAVVGMLSLLSLTAAQPTEAGNLPAGELNLGKITTGPSVSTKVSTAVAPDPGAFTASASPTNRR